MKASRPVQPSAVRRRRCLALQQDVAAGVAELDRGEVIAFDPEKIKAAGRELLRRRAAGD